MFLHVLLVWYEVLKWKKWVFICILLCYRLVAPHKLHNKETNFRNRMFVGWSPHQTIHNNSTASQILNTGDLPPTKTHIFYLSFTPTACLTDLLSTTEALTGLFIKTSTHTIRDHEIFSTTYSWPLSLAQTETTVRSRFSRSQFQLGLPHSLNAVNTLELRSHRWHSQDPNSWSANDRMHPRTLTPLRNRDVILILLTIFSLVKIGIYYYKLYDTLHFITTLLHFCKWMQNKGFTNIFD